MDGKQLHIGWNYQIGQKCLTYIEDYKFYYDVNMKNNNYEKNLTLFMNSSKTKPASVFRPWLFQKQLCWIYYYYYDHSVEYKQEHLSDIITALVKLSLFFFLAHLGVLDLLEVGR